MPDRRKANGGPRSVLQEQSQFNHPVETTEDLAQIIISVGYHVKSHRGTQFRIWAT